MEGLIFLIAAGLLLGVPLLALIFAIAAIARVRELKRAVESLRGKVDRLAAMAEREAPPASEAAPAAAPEPAPAAPAASDERPPGEEMPATPQPAPPSEELAVPPVETPPTPAAEEPAPAAAAAAAATAPARPRRSLEENLGTRLPMWIGAAALAFAGVFLVHYSIQRDLITPLMRVVLGLGFGVVLLVLGEWFATKRVRIAPSLSAAGIAVIFAALVAGVTLYQLISTAVGFGLIALTTLAAIALSLRRGPIVALVGLAGGFFTPALLASTDPKPAPLFAFFLVIQVALLFVARARSWWPLVGVAQLAGAVWVVLWLAADTGSLDRLVLGLFVLASVAPFVMFARHAAASEGRLGRIVTPFRLSLVASIVGALLLAALVDRGAYGATEWAFFGVLAAGGLALAAIDARYLAFPWGTLAASLALLAMWRDGGIYPEIGFYTTILIAMGALHAVGGYLAHLVARRKDVLAALAAASVVFHFSIAWAALDDLVADVPWGAIALGLAIAVTLSAWPRLARRDGERITENALAALLVGAVLLICLAVPLELERAWITVAWALAVAALAWLRERLRVPALEVLALLLTGAVVIRLLVNPFVLEYPTGTHPVFSWLLYGYGISALALALAAWLFRRQDDTRAATLVELAAVAVGGGLAVFGVRQYFSPGALTASLVNFAEMGSYGAVPMLYGTAIALLGWRVARRPLAIAGEVIVTATLLFTLAIPAFLGNPMWWHLEVGALLGFNALLVAYGVPALLALVAASRLADKARTVATLHACAGLWLLFVLVTAQVRQAFHGARVWEGVLRNAELYGYSIAWVLLGTAILIVGIWKGSTLLRFASLAIMLAAVAKVFLLDFSELQGLYRVFSFLGLGVSLLLLAFLYQRFVFRREES